MFGMDVHQLFEHVDVLALEDAVDYLRIGLATVSVNGDNRVLDVDFHNLEVL